MPGSQQDRPTTSYEHVWMLSKSARYYYDGDAVREPHREASLKRWHGELKPSTQSRNREGIYPQDGINTLHKIKAGDILNPAGRTLRSVWLINPQPLREAHFATYPPDLVEPMIKAGTSERGCCTECGNPWKRVIERKVINRDDWGPSNPKHATPQGIHGPSMRNEGRCGDSLSATIGWQPTCTCGGDTEPAIVLDPFMGAGTTALVAKRLGRNFLGIELNPEYIKIAENRICVVQPVLF